MRHLLTALLLIAPPLSDCAFAQQRLAPVLDIEAGWVGFADDGIVSEGLFGAGARWYASRRISVGPEIVYLAGPHHSHLVVTGNLTFEFAPDPNNGFRDDIVMLIPFVTIGGGMFQTRETFFDDAFTSSEGAFTAGGGVRFFVGDRFSAGIEARMGWEPHIRVNGTIGVRLGR